MLRGR